LAAAVQSVSVVMALSAPRALDAPTDKKGKFMSYNRFHKFEKRGMHIQLFEEIFSSFKVSEHPLICVTPVVDGEIYSS